MRWLRRVIAALASGALTSIAVACACALWSSNGPTRNWKTYDKAPPELRVPVPAEWLIVRSPDLFGRIMLDCYEDRGFGLLYQECTVGEWEQGIGSVYARGFVYHWSTGWPMQALQGSAMSDDIGDAWQLSGILKAPTWLRPRDRYWYNWPAAYGTCLPARPLPLGLALDSLLYATAYLLLFTAPGVARRAIRRRSGHCPTCAYDRRGIPATAPCPECGTGPT